MSTVRLEVKSLIPSFHLDHIKRDARNYYDVSIENISEIGVFKVKTDIDRSEFLRSEDILGAFFDPITSEIFHEDTNHKIDGEDPNYFLEIFYRPGVTDNSGRSAADALKLLDLETSVSKGKLFLIKGDLDKNDVEKIGKELIANTLIEKMDIYSFDEFKRSDRFSNVDFPDVELSSSRGVKEINLNVSEKELLEISSKRCLALNLDEMNHVKDYFDSIEVREKRKEFGLPLNPTDVELEILAQSWSEHCKHKIFSADIDYVENINEADYKKISSKKITGLYKEYIKRSTNEIKSERSIDWAVSVFTDNAGIVRFDENVDLSIKVETHNSPSALDPYGGSLTGILGVNRDILGVGMGSRPIANMDVFCFGELGINNSELPVGIKHPRRILEGVHLGVEDGGNKSGIPTVNGAINFDRDYAGKPLVFVGTVGVMPQKLTGGRESHEKNANVGDHVVIIGGAIGQDGIHGATFSSMELNEKSPATAVQIGDPLTQKRVLDFMLEARDLGLYSSVTDNGAGGLSSSVGEMAIATGGAIIDLSKCTVKYPGLSPYELMISESQERMTMAVPKSNLDEFISLSERRGVDASDIGNFNDNGYLEVLYSNETVAKLPLNYIHDSLSSMKLKARWDGPTVRKNWEGNNIGPADKSSHELDIKDVITKLLSRPNIVSKESLVRRYDHEVQAATHIKPFGGENSKAPNDSGVIWLKPHGGSKDTGVSIGCGLAPRISLYDPYYMAQFAVDEAIRNVVATGGDIDNCCLLDNFCWPDPVLSEKNKDGDYKLGQLVRTCEGLYDICKCYGTPLVSGKDSMKNDFRGKAKSGDELTISILPTLLVTAMSKCTMGSTSTSSFKNSSDLIYIIGKKANGLYGSEFIDEYESSYDGQVDLPEIDIEANKCLYKKLYMANLAGLINSCHDVSDGGAIIALAESVVGGGIGANLNFSDDSIEYLFSESPGRFIVSISSAKQSEFQKIFDSVEFELIGTTDNTSKLKFQYDDRLISLSNDELLNAWTKEL